MNQPAPEPTLEPTLEPETVPPTARRSLLPWLTLIGYLILVVAIAGLWYRGLTAPPPPDAGPALAALDARLTRLEHRAPLPPAATSDLLPRVEALERRASPDLTSLRARIADLEQRPADDMAGLIARTAALEKSLGRADRLTRVQAAEVALNAGRPLGDIPGAPAALTRFAHDKPPTEAALRLAFPAAATAALDASRPADDGKPIWTRLLARVQAPFTIRQGDHVVVGAPASGVLARAKAALDVGDLAGTIAALADLPGGSAAAMADWTSRATALRDARTALADMAAQP